MHIGVPKENKTREHRVAMTPSVAAELIKKGWKITIESKAGLASNYNDQAYIDQGVTVLSDASAVYQSADVILKVNAPTVQEIQGMKKGSHLISLLWAATNPDVIKAAMQQGINAYSLDAIPRISRAQKMDVLSSQANLAGYKAVLLAANEMGKILPMMTTAAGTIRPCKVVIFGAGVAGLQAIATAKRLGAVVEVSDIRPETKEQVESLGGKFIEVKGDSSVKMEGGYIKGVSDDFLKQQQELVSKHVAEADIVITTALIPGKKAPVLVTDKMVRSMRYGSVLIDMAVEQGGNVEGSKLHETVDVQGVKIIGEGNLPSLLPMNASDLFAKNIMAYLTHMAEPSGFHHDLTEEITAASLIVQNGEDRLKITPVANA